MDERENDAHKEKLQDTRRPPDQVAEERQKARHETDEHEPLQPVEKGMAVPFGEVHRAALAL
jgi:hypothetical protein